MASGTPRVGACGRILDNGCQRRKDSFHSSLSDLGLPFGRHQNLDHYGGRPQRDDVTPAIGILMALEPARSARRLFLFYDPTAPATGVIRHQHGWRRPVGDSSRPRKRTSSACILPARAVPRRPSPGVLANRRVERNRDILSHLSLSWLSGGLSPSGSVARTVGDSR